MALRTGSASRARRPAGNTATHMTSVETPATRPPRVCDAQTSSPTSPRTESATVERVVRCFPANRSGPKARKPIAAAIWTAMSPGLNELIPAEMTRYVHAGQGVYLGEHDGDRCPDEERRQHSAVPADHAWYEARFGDHGSGREEGEGGVVPDRRVAYRVEPIDRKVEGEPHRAHQDEHAHKTQDRCGTEQVAPRGGDARRLDETEGEDGLADEQRGPGNVDVGEGLAEEQIPRQQQAQCRREPGEVVRRPPWVTADARQQVGMLAHPAGTGVPERRNVARPRTSGLHRSPPACRCAVGGRQTFLP